MDIRVTLSANAGVALDLEGRRIWVDALHEKKQAGFSTVTPALQRRMLGHEAFMRPEWFCYTHNHPDHYSKHLTRAARKLWPQAWLMLPDECWNEEHIVVDDGLELRFVRLPHEGEQYADIKHFGLLISYQDRNILISGDCAVASPVLAELLAGKRVDLALLDFPWVTLRRGREFLQEHLPESQILLYHLPFAEDDVNGYRLSAENAAKQLTNCRLLMEPLQTIHYNL